RKLLDTLSRSPDRAWPEAVIHHGARLLLLLALVGLVQLLIPVSPVPDFPALEKGMVAPRDVIAEVPFMIPKNPAELAEEQDAAAAAVAPVYRDEPSAVDSMLSRVRGFVAHLDSAAATAQDASGVRANVRQMLTTSGFPVDDDAVELLSNPTNRRILLGSMDRVIRNEMPAGIVASTDDMAAPQ